MGIDDVSDVSTGFGFIGREAEVRGLLAGLDAATSGFGRLFLIRGEPGIGKTRMAVEFASRAREQGVRVLWGRCSDTPGAPAYWPWVQALRSIIRSTERDELL